MSVTRLRLRRTQLLKTSRRWMEVSARNPIPVVEITWWGSAHYHPLFARREGR